MSRGALAIVVGVMAIAAASYFIFQSGDNDEDVVATSNQLETRTIRVGYLPSLAASPLYSAIAEGDFTSKGLDVELVEVYSGPDIITAVENGSVDFAFGIVPPLIAAKARGSRVVSVAGATVDGPEIREHRLLLPIDSAVSEPTDLIGKRIAVVARGTSDHFSLVAYFERNGVPIETVDLIPTPHPEMITAVSSNAVDAAASIEPFISIGASRGEVKVFDYYYSDSHETEVGTYLASLDLIEQSPELVEAFVDAISAGITRANDHVYLRELLSKVPALGIKFSVSPAATKRLTIMKFNQRLSAAGTERTVREMLNFEVLQETVPFDQLIWIPGQDE